MIKSASFIRDMIAEVRTWTEKGIITRDQQKKIESLYTPSPSDQTAVTKSDSKKSPINITAVIISLASLCLIAGIIVFYAANWKKMPPSLKLLQIFLILFGSYAASAWFLFSKDRSRIIGRAFLVIGMMSFGAGIMLVAQIYHISAHPTNGLFVWACGVFIMSLLMKERFGLYIASSLFFIWNCWEFFVYNNPAYLYLLFIALLSAAYIWAKDKIGIVASFCFLLFYYFQVTSPIHYNNDFEYHLFQLGLLNFALGALLFSAGVFFRDNDTIRPLGILMTIAGWFFFILPFTTHSWPFGEIGSDIIASFAVNRLYSSLYLAFIALSILFIMLQYKKEKSIAMSIAVVTFPVIALFLPLGITQVRMVTMHCAIIALFFAFLFISYNSKKKDAFDTAFAYIFAFILIIVKGFGFLFFSLYDDKFKVAYLAGFIIFAIVCLLLNVLISHITAKRGGKYPSTIIHTLCAAMTWIAVYTASFETPSQHSITTANPIVITMVVLFSTIAVILFALLVSILKEKRVIVFLAGAIFAVTLTCMLLAGPDTSWIFYSLMFNTLLVIFTSVYIYYSTVIQSKALLNIMVTAFVIHIVTRYFDLFWDMLSGSVFLIVTGLVGFAGGYLLIRKRRSIARMIEKSGSAASKA
jgi:uncharacterized membrane protein